MILAIFLIEEILKFGMGLRVFLWLKWKGFHGLVHVHVEPLKSDIHCRGPGRLDKL